MQHLRLNMGADSPTLPVCSGHARKLGVVGAPLGERAPVEQAGLWLRLACRDDGTMDRHCQQHAYGGVWPLSLRAGEPAKSLLARAAAACGVVSSREAEVLQGQRCCLRHGCLGCAAAELIAAVCQRLLSTVCTSVRQDHSLTHLGRIARAGPPKILQRASSKPSTPMHLLDQVCNTNPQRCNSHSHSSAHARRLGYANKQSIQYVKRKGNITQNHETSTSHHQLSPGPYMGAMPAMLPVFMYASAASYTNSSRSMARMPMKMLITPWAPPWRRQEARGRWGGRMSHPHCAFRGLLIL